jgi:hypothetical protein
MALTLAAVALVAVAALPAPATSVGARGNGDLVSGVDFLTENQPIGHDGPEFKRIRADGANTVSFDVWWVLPSFSSSGPVTPLLRATDSDADLVSAAQQARQAGLRVTLTPKLVVHQGAGYAGWRGDYNPPDPAAFFASYQSMIDHYAGVAQWAGISILVVGSEMVDLDEYVPYWRQVISSARQRFTGQIGYEVDWREISKFSFGDAVDVLLLSAYFATSNEEHPTLAQLMAGWHSYLPPGASQPQDAFSEVADLAHRWGKRIVFGEAGYTATTYPAQEPWWNKPDPPDIQSQYLGYQALLATFAGQPWWGGVLWWAWNNGDPRSPEGKPAESLISAQCVSLGVIIKNEASQTNSGSAQGVSGPGICDPPRVAAAAIPASTHRLVIGLALAAFILAAAAFALFGGWLQSSPRRRREDGLAMG